MTEPKTLPQSFSIPLTAGNAVHDAWLVRTDTLLGAFERQLPSQRSGSPSPALGFIILASDYLWLELREAAHFAKLNVREFVEHCRELLSVGETLRSFVDTLASFYDFLGRTQSVEPDTASRIAAEFRSVPAELTRPFAYPAR